MKWTRIFMVALLMVFSITVYGEDNLKFLLDNGLISLEEYEILQQEKYIEDGEVFYNLMINGELKSKIFEILVEDGSYYIPVQDFFKQINFKNYTYTNGKLIAIIGESLERVEIDVLGGFIKKGERVIEASGKVFDSGGEVYLEQEVFKEIFLNYLAINSENQKINMTLSFSTPDEISLRMKITEKILAEKRNTKELLFTNKPTMFELGYLRLNASTTFTKDKNISDRFESDWSGNLEYQGAMLYGQFTANYDLKNRYFKDMTLRYDEVYTNHMLEIGNYSVGEKGAREWEVTFKKDRGYYVTGNKNYIIRDNVEIGSRVELLYLDTVIDIQTAESGVVEFNREEIKEDREYKLRIYTPDGKVYEKIINTTSNYNQQNKGEVEYDVSLRERDEISKVDFNSNVYYGVTDEFTIGGGYDRTATTINDKNLYLNKLNLEGIYSSSIKSIPYTFRIGGDKTLDSEKDNITGRDTKDDYSLNYLAQVDLRKLRLKLEQTRYGKYSDIKKEQSFYIRYPLFNSIDLGYEISKTTKYKAQEGEKRVETDKTLSVEYSKAINNFMITGQYNRVMGEYEDTSEYGLNLYYTGWRTITTRLENSWTNNGDDYEVALSLFNTGNNTIDYSLEARYSEREKDRLTFRFTIRLDNWFRYEGNIDKLGNQSHTVGIDRIIDLKNPTVDISSMNSSRVKVITFVDMNNNDIFDEGEQRIEKVEVKIGDKKAITNKNGEALFYGIPNDVLYDLKPEIRKPNFLLGNNKIQIKGKHTSTITAYIPVKPMVSLTGIVNIDKALNKSAMEKIRIYDEILVQVKDLSGKVIDMAIPDNTGVFEISGLFPEQYFIEVQYTGIDYSIRGVNEIIQLTYVEEDEEGNRFFFAFNTDEIIIEKKEEEING